MKAVSSWGRLSSLEHEVVELDDRLPIVDALGRHLPGIAIGMGRSYGDACLNPGGVLWSTSRLDRFIAFDPDTGILECETGALLRDIQRWAIPLGWGLPVIPGTQLVTVGGAIANDVHGKNHHVRGTFGHNVVSLRLVRTSGQTIDCGPEVQAEWFAATVAGLGLTGLIAKARIQLVRVPGPWLDAETIAYDGLARFLELAQESDREWEHTVSWIDCTSTMNQRGLFMRARPIDHGAPAPKTRGPLRVPVAPPVSLINGLTLRPFNRLYYHLTKRAGRQIVPYEPFLFPLDNVLDWNRMYGPRGFFQYQCVVPHDTAAESIGEMLRTIAAAGEGSVLAVLKTFGNRQPFGLLSFARSGVTLALDFPNKGTRTLALFERLDAILHRAGGRIYLAKDARMPRALFEATYEGLDRFARYRDPGMSSAMSRRLLGS